MSTRSPSSVSGECAEAEDARLGSSGEPTNPTVHITLGDQEPISHVIEPIVKTNAARDARVGDALIDAAVLSEVHSSLQSISNGVEELTTTVQDIFGLSDSDSNTSEDYEIDRNGQLGGRHAWGRVRSHARKRRQLRKKQKAASCKTNVAQDESKYDGEGPKQYPAILLDVRECDLENFQSRPAGASYGLHCVDILVAGHELERESPDFGETITSIKSGALEGWKPRHIPDRAADPSSQDGGKKWIRRIRINSRAVMDALHYMCPPMSESVALRPTVFHRPFQLLVSLHGQFKVLLSEVSRSAFFGANEQATPGASRMLMIRDIMDWGSAIQNPIDEKNAIGELKCFVDFMESRIIPDSLRYRNPSSPSSTTIRAEDLWYLFKPGDLVYVSRRDKSDRDRFRSTPFSQPFLRVIETYFGRKSPLSGSIDQPWSILGHFIEHDGTSYEPVCGTSLPFGQYFGEKKVTDLPVYPIAYLEDGQLIAQALSDGETYANLIERRSGFYSGWSLTVNPLGLEIEDNIPERRITAPQHIESDILVDFQETFNTIPAWKPDFYQPVGPPWAEQGFGNLDLLTQFTTRASDLPIIEWDDRGRIQHDTLDRVIVYDATEDIEGKRFLQQDGFGYFRKATRRVPTGLLLALLPRRFFAYAVLERKFFQLSTRYVRSAEMEANDKAFENLEINPIYKQLILALVKSHFDKVETEKRTNVEIESQDLIRGKGKGVVILLHGVPGVGKTATAEAVALKWKKPLFPITCGDLGYTAETLEKSLNEIFRLAHHWGCILLLDEADVFITQRERHDLKRNALVSAFLRVLEYYNGILFLTTNRAGVLDEAIKSRVHLNLYYDHLTEKQTIAIFKQHIQRLRNIERQRNPDQNEQIMVLHKEIIQFASDHFNQGGNNQGPGNNFGRWNGRQIRNAFLIASSLAHYDSEEDGEEDKDELAEHGRKKQKQLGRSQFELVAQTTLMYDQYRQSVHSGKSDDHVAFEREERAMSSQPRSPTPVRMQSASMGFN